MNVYVYVYEGHAQFESIILNYVLNTQKHNVVTFSHTKQSAKSVEGIKIEVDKLIEDVNVHEVDALIIPGGYSYDVLGNEKLQQLLQAASAEGIIMGAICHGPVLFAEAGILEGKNYTSNVGEDEVEYYNLFKGNNLKVDLVVHDHIITATGNAYVEFAFAVIEKLGVVEESTQKALYNFFKNVKQTQTV